MIRSELVLRLAELNPQLYQQDCEALVNTILDRITEALAAGDRVELRNFGAFTTTDLRARQCRNPRTGEAVTVAEKKAVHFKPGDLAAAEPTRVGDARGDRRADAEGVLVGPALMEGAVA